MKCLYCSSTTFRRSKMREIDVLHLALLEYPVRCLRCSQRQYVPFIMAALSVSSRVRHPSLPRAHETWGAWTGGTEQSPASHEASAAAAPRPPAPSAPPEDSRNVW